MKEEDERMMKSKINQSDVQKFKVRLFDCSNELFEVDVLSGPENVHFANADSAHGEHYHGKFGCALWAITANSVDSRNHFHSFDESHFKTSVRCQRGTKNRNTVNVQSAVAV